MGPGVHVLDDADVDVPRGSGAVGLVAVAGCLPLGYHNDSVKTDATFRTIDGVRYAVPGDFASVDEDGTVRLLGRGSLCINTGGEKVFPEEVEARIKEIPGSRRGSAGDPGRAVRGTSRRRSGDGRRSRAAQRRADRTPASEAGRVQAAREVLLVDSVSRMENGKIDYRRLRDLLGASLLAPQGVGR